MRTSFASILATAVAALAWVSASAQSDGGFVTPVSQTVCEGSTAELEVVSFTGNIVRWEYSTDPTFGTGVVAVAHTDANYITPPLTEVRYYRAVVQDGAFAEDASTTGAISLNAPSNAGSIIPPAESTVCQGTDGALVYDNVDTGTIVRWQKSNDNFTSDVVNINNTSFIQTWTDIQETTWFRVEVKNGVCPSDYSAPQQIVVDSPPEVGTLSVDVDRHCGTTNSFTLSHSDYAGGGRVWQRSTDNFASDIQTFPASGDDRVVTDLAQTTYFRVRLNSLNGVCSNATTNVVTVTIHPETVAGTVGNVEATCQTTGEGEVTLMGYTGQIVRWQSSSDDFASDVTDEAGTDATLSISGVFTDRYYRAEVQSGICPAAFSNSVLVEIAEPSLGGTAAHVEAEAVCATANTGTISLSGQRGEIVRWERLVNDAVVETIDQSSAPYIFSDLSETSELRAIVANGACPAEPSAPATVQVDPATVPGTVSGQNTICVTTTDAALTLAGHVGDVVRWEESSDDFGADINPLDVTDPSLTPAVAVGTTYYRAVVQSGVCAESATASLERMVDDLTDPGTLPELAPSCGPAGPVDVVSAVDRGSILRWEYSTDDFTDNVTVDNSTPTTYSFTNLTETTYVRVVVQNGVCPEVAARTVQLVGTTSVAGAITSAENSVCEGGNIAVQLTDYTGDFYDWQTSTNDFATEPGTADRNSESYLLQGVTERTWVRAIVTSGSCDADTTESYRVNVDRPSIGGTVEGHAPGVELDNQGTLSIAGRRGAVVAWHQAPASDFATFDVVGTNNTHTYTNLADDAYFRAEVMNGQCPSALSDVGHVYINHYPTPADDFVEAFSREDLSGLTADLLTNDTDPNGTALYVLPGTYATSRGGSVQYFDDGTFVYTPDPLVWGIDVLEYEACDSDAPRGLCTTAFLEVDLSFREQLGPLRVFDYVSPNGDGKNDWLTIGNIEHYPQARVQVFDRNGMVVFDQVGYENDANKAFAGIANTGLVGSGNRLSEGTYFYAINLGDGQEQLTGYFILRR